jgi:RNA polymerase-interacting CarD/CdnL/TRCF family regulator
MINTLHQHKKVQAEAGRKFHLCDENFLRDAEKLLNAEFSLVLGIQPADVGAYILSAMDQ